MTTVPPVSVLVSFSHGSGREQLDACLSSIKALEYPADRLIIDVVGDRAACNAAVERARTAWVAVLQADTRVDLRWLKELTASADRNDVSAIASKILDGSGDRIESCGADVWLTGQSSSRHVDESREITLLFAPAAAMLVKRDAFLEAGGFDTEFLSQFDDVDLGWRLHLLGHRTCLAPAAVVYQRQAAPSTRWTDRQRWRVSERNALAMIYKNCESETLKRLLPVAVSMSLLRGLRDSGIERLRLHFDERLPLAIEIDQRLVAHLIGLEDFSGWLEGLTAKRKAIQASRRQADADLFPLFAGVVPPDLPAEHQQIAAVLIDEFGIAPLMRCPGSASSAPGAEPSRTPMNAPRGVASSTPRVSVIVLTVLGTEYLEDCLTSLRTQNYPAEQCEVIVVDNGSASPVTAAIEDWYPGVRVVRNATNVGFARGNNIGAGLATGEYLFFLNDDTRVDPDCVKELVATIRSHGAAAAGACLLDWRGRTIDFAGGAVNFEGKGLQPGHGADRNRLDPGEKPLLFACGGALLIDRHRFMEAGQWDDGSFAYYEDVELGWRLNVLGDRIWFSPRAIVYHKQHGTAGRWADAPRTRLFQRNSLRTIYSLLDVNTLARVLPAALMLAADRALLMTNLSRVQEHPARSSLFSTIERQMASLKTALRERGIGKRTPLSTILKTVGREAAFLAGSIVNPGAARVRYSIRDEDPHAAQGRDVETIPLPAAAILSGILSFLLDLPTLAIRRREIQMRRLMTDAELLQRFGGEWTTPSGSVHAREHEDVQRRLIDVFGIGEH